MNSQILLQLQDNWNLQYVLQEMSEFPLFKLQIVVLTEVII